MKEDEVRAKCLQFRIYGDRDSNMRELSRAFGCRPGLTDGDDITQLSMVTCLVPVKDGKNGCIGTGIFAFPHLKAGELEDMAGRMAKALGMKLETVNSSDVDVRDINRKAEKALDDSKKFGRPGIPYLSHAYIAIQSGSVPLLFYRGDDLGKMARKGLGERVESYESSVIVITSADTDREKKDEGKTVAGKGPSVTVLVPHENERGGRSR